MVEIASFVLDVVKCLAAPIGRPFMYLYNYKKNIGNLQDEVTNLKNTSEQVQVKVTAAEIDEEEITQSVKDWQTKVNNIITEAERLVEEKVKNPGCFKGLRPNCITQYKHSKKAFNLKRDVIDPLLRQEESFGEVSYSSFQSNYGKNFDKLRDDASKLKNARLKVQRKVKEAENNVEEIEEDVKKWLEDVDSIIVKAEELIQNQSSIGTDWETRYRNSKAASELMVDNIGPLLQQEERFDKVSHPTIPLEIWLRTNEDYLAFESRNSTLKNVWDALQDEKIYMMGVYGMGGLGKTTLVQEIGRKAEKDKLFDEIVFVEVTETPDTKKIQTIIANKLGLKFEDAMEDQSQRANKLYSRMEKKNILLIVDNIWGELDLKIVGIPYGADRGRSKILMTTRNLDVLENMGSTKNLEMGILNEEEAWSLFKKMTGGVIQTRELISLPQDVCKECGGLPIVICTIAKALKNKSRPSDWKVALQELKKPSPTKFIGLLEKEYMKIALSYKYLRNDELKKTFLMSSLMKNNTSISSFFIHVMGLDILEGANLKMEEARDRLDKLVCELKDSCLLIDGFTSEQFAMHDVVRAVAVTISYTDHHVFTGRNDVERDWKDKDKLKKCTKISLPGSSTVISQLWPKDLDCPNLEYFCMTNTWDSSYEIPADLFTVMPKLKVLNLFGMRHPLLPSSFDLLKNLQTLCLDYSRIEDVAIIGKLKKLKVLSLQYSSIGELPTEIGQLTQLKLFDLSNCRGLKIIVPNVISKLLQLEEFYVKGCPIQWKVEVLEELKLLSQLASLELDIKDNELLPKDLFSKKLKRYKISIGDWSTQYVRYNKDGGLRIFELKLNSTISLEELRGIKNVELLRLAEFSDVETSFNDFVTLTPLLNEKVIFTNLMALELNNCSSGKIWDNQFPTLMSSSYQNLTHFILWRCKNIKYVFPSSIAKSLQTLQYLEIEDCEILEEIVAEEEGAKAAVNFAFLQVTFLKFENLPKLTAFYSGIHILELPMLKILMVENCEKFTSKYLNFHENSLHISESKSPSLEDKINHELEVFELQNGFKTIEWQSQSRVFEIKYDDSTNFPLTVLQRFENLKELKLCWCHQYKELFFPNLSNLEVLDVQWCSKLMSLMSFSTSFQNLKVLRVGNCRKLMKLITPSIARSLEQLREIDIYGCEMLIEIVEDEEEGDATSRTKIVFDNLKMLLLRNLESLICFCSVNYSFNLPVLEELNIGECPNMKIFSQGILSTPKLHKVNYERLNMTKRKWEKIMEVENKGNDLNKTIRGAYKKQDIFLDLKFLKFQDDNSTEICYNQRPNSFYQNLTHLILSGCENIKYAFPSSIAKSLHHLQQLKIQNCKLLEEIIAKEEGANAIVNFDFPNVTLLNLENLPELTALYPEIHTSEWPMLKELMVINCDKFTSKHMSFQENSEEGSKPKSLFLDNKINHELEVFELGNNVKAFMWQSQSKAFEIRHDDSGNFPLTLLQRFENMKELKLSWCYQYKELFFPNLPNLEVLEVLICSNLMSLMPFSISFQNLNVLSVYYCDGLMKLITPSITRSLVQLREMSVDCCEILIEIVENDGEGDATTSTEIVFGNLKKLSLKSLGSLICFCYGNYSFNFPYLKELNIEECPNMKIFSQGILNAPKLHEVNYKCWTTMEVEKMEVEIDLNTTIQQAHKKQVDSNMNMKELTLSGRRVSEELWQSKNSSIE